MLAVLTVLEAHVAPAREPDLKAAYRQAAQDPFPPGLLHSSLLRVAGVPTRWHIATLWESRDALDAMRDRGSPRGVLIFRAAGAEPTLTVLEVVDELAPVPGAA